jgi:hypothetical protein
MILWTTAMTTGEQQAVPESGPNPASTTDMMSINGFESPAGRGRGRFAGVWRAATAALALTGTLLLASCHSKVTEGRSAVYLIMNDLAGAKSGSTTFTNVLRSDVSGKNGTIWEDNGRVILTVALKDVTSPTGPTTNNFVTINRYHIVFRRSDGRNTQGVDVPYAFDGAITFTVTGSATTGIFTLVRPQAKLEAPLRALRGLGGALLISTLADVTFYGFDQTGTEVSVTGTMSVNFADWADDDE